MIALTAFIIGGLFGFFVSALLSCHSWDEAYAQGANRMKTVIINRLMKMKVEVNSEQHIQLVKIIKMLEEI